MATGTFMSNDIHHTVIAECTTAAHFHLVTLSWQVFWRRVDIATFEPMTSESIILTLHSMSIIRLHETLSYVASAMCVIERE